MVAHSSVLKESEKREDNRESHYSGRERCRIAGTCVHWGRGRRRRIGWSHRSSSSHREENESHQLQEKHQCLWVASLKSHIDGQERKKESYCRIEIWNEVEDTVNVTWSIRSEVYIDRLWYVIICGLIYICIYIYRERGIYVLYVEPCWMLRQLLLLLSERVATVKRIVPSFSRWRMGWWNGRLVGTQLEMDTLNSLSWSFAVIVGCVGIFAI